MVNSLIFSANGTIFQSASNAKEDSAGIILIFIKIRIISILGFIETESLLAYFF